MEVTKEQYEKALEIVMVYRSQLIKELDMVNSKILDEENLQKLYVKGLISARLRNNVCRHLSLYLKDLDANNYESYTLKDLFRLERSQIIKFRNSGKKNLLEFDKLKEKYSI